MATPESQIAQRVAQMVESGQISRSFARDQLNRTRPGLADEVLGPEVGQESFERFATGQAPTRGSSGRISRESAKSGLVDAAGILGSFLGPTALSFAARRGLPMVLPVLQNMAAGSSGAVIGDAATRVSVLGQDPETAVGEALSTEGENLVLALPFMAPAGARLLGRRQVQKQIRPDFGSAPNDFIDRAETNFSVGSAFRQAKAGELDKGKLADELKSNVDTARSHISNAVKGLRSNLLDQPLQGDLKATTLSGIADELTNSFDGVFSGASRVEFNVTLGSNPQLEALVVSEAGLSKADLNLINEAVDQINKSGTIGELIDARQFIQKDFGKGEGVTGRVRTALQSGVSAGVKNIDAALSASDRVFSEANRAVKIVEEAGQLSRRSPTAQGLDRPVDYGLAAQNMPVSQRRLSPETPEGQRQIALRRTLAIAENGEDFLKLANDFEVLPDGTVKFGIDDFFAAADELPTRAEKDLLNKSTGLQLQQGKPNDTGLISTAQGTAQAVEKAAVGASTVAPAVIASGASPSFANTVMQLESVRRDPSQLLPNQLLKGTPLEFLSNIQLRGTPDEFLTNLGPQQAASLITRGSPNGDDSGRVPLEPLRP